MKNIIFTAISIFLLSFGSAEQANACGSSVEAINSANHPKAAINFRTLIETANYELERYLAPMKVAGLTLNVESEDLVTAADEIDNLREAIFGLAKRKDIATAKGELYTHAAACLIQLKEFESALDDLNLPDADSAGLQILQLAVAGVAKSCKKLLNPNDFITQPEPDLESFKLSDLITPIVNEFGPLARANHQNLVTTVRSGDDLDTKVVGDLHKLRLVLKNLLRSAFDRDARNITVDLTVTHKNASQEERVKIVVKDDGCTATQPDLAVETNIVELHDFGRILAKADEASGNLYGFQIDFDQPSVLAAEH